MNNETRIEYRVEIINQYGEWVRPVTVAASKGVAFSIAKNTPVNENESAVVSCYVYYKNQLTRTFIIKE